MKTTTTTGRKPLQYICLYTIATVGLIAFMVLAGDDDPQNPLPLGRWFLIKGCAAAVIYLMYLLGKHLAHRGFLPEMKDEEEEE